MVHIQHLWDMKKKTIGVLKASSFKLPEPEIYRANSKKKKKKAFSLTFTCHKIIYFFQVFLKQ